MMSEAGTRTVADAKWYIVHTYSNFEKKVSEEIKRQAKLQDLEEFVADVIVPTEDVIEVRRGQKVNSERKFLPGYVLLHAKLTDEVYHLVKNVAKVTGFLGQNNKPMPLRQSEVDRILNQVTEGAEHPKSTITFEIGDRISLPPGGLSVAPPLPPGQRIRHALTSSGHPLAVDADGASVTVENLPVTATLFLGSSDSPTLA